MHTTNNNTREQGYILLYVLLAMTLFAILASSVLKGTVEDVELGAQELAAVKAQAAADAAAECISYWARQPNFPFNTNSPSVNINCSSDVDGASINTPTSPNAHCTDTVEEYTVDGGEMPELVNESCAEVTVTVEPRRVAGIFKGPGDSGPLPRTPLCSLRVQAVGYDDCATRATSRVRWETIGGWSTTSDQDENIAYVVGDEPALEDPSVSAEGYSVDANVEEYAVLQVEVSGVEDTLHESNAIEIWGDFVDTIPPESLPPDVDAVDEVVWYEVVNDDALGAFAGSVRYEFRDDYDSEDTDPLFTRFGEPTHMTVEVPGDTPPGFYRLAVRVRYGALAYDDVMVYLDVTNAGRGQE